MRHDKTNRRVFLTGAGGAALALPFLPSLEPRSFWRSAHAAPPPNPRRFIAIKTYNGTPLRAFYPGARSGYETTRGDERVRPARRLSEPTGRHSNGDLYYGHWEPLSALSSSGVSQVFGASFERHLANTLLLRGLDIMPNLNHNHGAMLGNLGLRTNGVGGALPGAQINVTADQIMARSASVYSNPPSGPRILHLGSRTNSFSYAPRNPDQILATGLNAVERAQAFTNPRIAFDALFPDGGGAGSGQAPERSASARVVDRVIEDYRRAVRGPNLSQEDRTRLDLHMTRLSELEARLGAGSESGSGCSVPAPPSNLDTGGEFDTDPSEITALFERMVDIIVLALACDLTRVVTLDVAKMVIRDRGDVFGMGDSERANSAGRENWHYQAHRWDDNAIRWLSAGAEWVASEVILRLLDGLDQTEESNGSLLHNSMVVWSNELSFNHLGYSLPTALFGQGGGYFETGRYIDYINHERPVRFRQHDGPVVEGVQYNRFLATLFDAMGVQPAEYELEPGAGFGESRPVEKSNAWAIDYDASRVGQPLPGMGPA